MAKLAQGTSLFFLKDATTVVKTVATSISGISAQRDSLDSTDLESTAKTFMPGLISPGTAQFTVQFDPSNTAHKDLHAAYVAGTTMEWALGWSDGTEVPTATAGALTLPTARSFLSFDGFIQDVAFDFSVNSIVTAQISLQISGMPALTPKV